MAYVQTSNESNDDLKAVSKPTGRLRWYQPLKGGRELQQEWRSDVGMEFWIVVPTYTELSE